MASSGAAPSSSQAQVLQPSLVSVLAWYRGDSAVAANPMTNNVTVWRDLSGRGNHALPPVNGAAVQAVANALGTHTGVAFPGNAWLDSLAVGGGTKGITIFMVFSGANPQSLVRMQNAGGWVVLPWGNEKRFLVSSENGTTGVATGLDTLGSNNAAQWHLASGTYRAAPGVFETRLDGAVVASQVSLSALAVPQAPLRLGALVVDGAGFEFAIATVLEILVYEAQLDEREFGITQTYLMQRYGLP